MKRMINDEFFKKYFSFRNDKCGTDKILSVYWFVILFLVTIGIVYMASLFYGELYDVREIEGEILVNKVADCLSKKGELVEGWREINNENFLEKCNLNFNLEDIYGWEDDQFFVRIDFENFNNQEKARESISVGNFNLEDFCNKKGSDLPVCIKRNLYSMDDGEEYLIKIKTIVRKTEKNVNL